MDGAPQSVPAPRRIPLLPAASSYSSIGASRCLRRARRNWSGWCNGSRSGSAVRSSARGSLHATSKTPIW